VRTVAEGLPSPLKQLYLQLLIPGLTDSILDVIGQPAAIFDPILHNTVTATTIQGGEGFNMIPSQVQVGLDCRLLPGFTPDDIKKELRAFTGEDVELEMLYYGGGMREPDMGLFNTLADVLRESDKEGIPVPMLFPAVTDSRVFDSIGIQTYGFTPMNLPPDIEFDRLFHAANERIPVKSLEFGAEAIYKLLQRFGR